jgi:tyrosyl-tRNA synthetase
MPTFAPVKEQMDEIRRDTVEIIPEDDLVRKLERSAKSGEPLRIKQGFDPTRPDLHIGQDFRAKLMGGTLQRVYD